MPDSTIKVASSNETAAAQPKPTPGNENVSATVKAAPGGSRPHVTPVSAVNLEYAEKYIQHLNKRNRNLNIGRGAWMLAAIVMGAFAGKTYMDLQNSQFQLRQQSMALKTELQSVQASEGEWQQKAERAQAELLKLQQGFSQLTDGQASTSDDNMIQSLSNKINEYESRTAQLQSERDNLLTQYKSLKKTLEDIESQFANVSSTKEDTLKLLEQKQARIDELSTKLSFSNDQLTGLKKQLDDSKAGFEALARRYQDTKRDQQSLVAQVDKSRTELTEQKKLVKESEQKLQASAAELEKLKIDHAALQDSLRLMVQPIIPGK
ncbi:MAG: hypothetical protein H7A00_08295 [Hahellaceae bacterium]|nr:hypothetical protein [Hahellaceae bacterium]